MKKQEPMTAFDYKFGVEAPIEYYTLRRPKGARSKLILLPFYRYSVQSPMPKARKIDIFEKVVLGLLNIKYLTPGEMGQELRLDQELILLLISRLQGKDLLDSKGKVTQLGKDILQGEEFFHEVNTEEMTTGYVYQNPISTALYPRFNPNPAYVDTIKDKGWKYPKIDLSTRGKPQVKDGLFCFLKEGLQLPPRTPSSKEIYEAVRKHSRALAFGELSTMPPASAPPNLDKIFLLEDTPELIWIATYLYIREDERYLDIWHVLDPFGLGSNGWLRDYLKEIAEENKHVQEQMDALSGKFENKRQEDFVEQREHLQREARKEIDQRFGLHLKDDSLLYKQLLRLEMNYRSLGLLQDKGSLAKEARVIFERMFKMIIKKKKQAYRRIEHKLIQERSQADRQINWDVIEQIAYNLQGDIPLPKPLLNYNRNTIKNIVKYYKTSGKLAGMMTASLLAADNDSNHTLAKMLPERPRLLHEIQAFSIERNQDASIHDSTKDIRKDIVEVGKDRDRIFDIIQLFINKYF